MYMWLATFVASITFLAHQCFAGAGTNLLQKKKHWAGWEQLDKKAALVPGMPELGMGVPTNKFAFRAGVEPHPSDRYRSGNPKYDTCQPWEDCEKWMSVNQTQVTTTPAPTMNMSKEANATFFNRPNATCDNEWDLTKQGCQCFDACECNRPTPSGARICKTLHIRTVSYTNRVDLEPCGNYDPSTEKFYDTCQLQIAPAPRPEIGIRKKKKKKESEEEEELYRDFDGKKTMRFLPQSSCFSKTFYCSQFPRFEGCVPGITYEYSEDMLKKVEECKAIEDQKDCTAKESCGKGKDKTCHHQCLWSEDAPGWFRELRGKQTMWLKRHKRDPATIGKGSKLPILQPAWDGGDIRSLQDGADVIIKGAGKKAGATTTTPPPKSVAAGKVGTGRSAGFVPASDVGKNVGNDVSFHHESNEVFFPEESDYDLKKEGTLLSVSIASAPPAVPLPPSSGGADEHAEEFAKEHGHEA